MIPRLYDAQGSVIAGGHNVKDQLENLRKEISVATKDVLFSGTIGRKFIMGDENASLKKSLKPQKLLRLMILYVLS